MERNRGAKDRWHDDRAIACILQPRQSLVPNASVAKKIAAPRCNALTFLPASPRNATGKILKTELRKQAVK